MKRVLDLAMLWIYCLMAAIFVPVDIPFVAASLAAVIYGCGSSLVRSGGIRFGLTLLFLSFSVICPQFLIYVPLTAYTLLDAVQPAAQEGNPTGLDEDMACRLSPGCDILDARSYVSGFLVCCFGAAFYLSSDRALIWFTAVGCMIAGVVQYQTGRYGMLDEKYRRTRDDSVEKNLLLREKNQSLLEKQDYEIYTATLRERNRIAREIHDNVGHMLSRSILMVGAMKAVHGEGSLKEPLCRLEDTLSAAMTSVRESVHDLHDEAINLKEVLESLTGEYTFCQARLVYDMGYEVPREIRYGFIAIVKEALNNVMKHSNATWVQVVAREHPGMYQLVIEDNGTSGIGRKHDGYGGGIGIRNMKERVDTFGGNLEIQTQKGWRIHITVPKKADER
ncbi:MAG: sensor histidine kinase [Dorea sp.]|jgi:signal transduction histidine kinase|nr:sensor histidine kinase [Dorea sp.]